MSKPHRVVIVGAGIAGLTAAVLLEQQGIQVRVYDSGEPMQHSGGGLRIWPDGAAVLNKVFGDALLPSNGRVKQLTIATQHNEAIAYTPETTFKNVLFPNFFVARAALKQALLQRLTATAVAWGKRCQNFVSNAEGIQVFFDDETVIEADILLAADGLDSSIRLQMFGHAPLNYAGYITLGGLIPAAKLPKGFANYSIAPQRLQWLLPVSQDKYYCFLARPFALEAWPAISADPQQQRQLFSGWSPVVDQLLQTLEEAAQQNCEHYFCAPAFDLPLLPHFAHQRVALLGDAAHPIGSLFGLGTTLALSGVGYLVQCLQQTSDSEQALLRYSKRQRILAENMLLMEAQEKHTLLTEDRNAFMQRAEGLRKTSAQLIWQPFVKAFEVEEALVY